MQRTHRGGTTVITGLLTIAGFIFASSSTGYVGDAKAAATWLSVPLGERCEQHQGSFLDANAPDMLRRLSVVFYEEDRITAFPDPALGIGSLVTLCRAPEVTINDAGSIRTVRSWAPDVQSLAVEQRLELAAKDELNVDLEDPITNGISFSITRVAETELVVNVSLPFSTQYQDDPTLNKGVLKTKQRGSVGNRADTYLVRRENSKEVSRTKVASEVTQEPTAEIVIRGTKPVITVSCRYQDAVLTAAARHGLDPNSLCYRMMRESNGRPNAYNSAGPYLGLFQYQQDLWPTLAAKAGYPGADVWDPVSQINVTAWAWANGHRSRWPNP